MKNFGNWLIEYGKTCVDKDTPLYDFADDFRMDCTYFLETDPANFETPAQVKERVYRYTSDSKVHEALNELEDIWLNS